MTKQSFFVRKRQNSIIKNHFDATKKPCLVAYFPFWLSMEVWFEGLKLGLFSVNVFLFLLGFFISPLRVG